MITTITNQCQEQDDIRNYLHVLKKVPGKKDKYYCRICDGSNLSIGKHGYTCYSNECDTKEILKTTLILAGAWIENSNTGGQNHRLQIKPKNKQAKTSKPKLKHQPVS